MQFRRSFLAVALLLVGRVAAGNLVPELVGILAGRSVSRLTREEMLQLDDRGLLEALQARDPYARYFSPEEYAAQRVSAQAVGIGVQLFEDHGRLLLVPYPKGPAFQAGLKTRVRLLRVDGIEVTGEPLERVAARVQGSAGSIVRLQVSSNGGAIESLAMVRAPFTVPVAAMVKEDGLLLLRIWNFRARETALALRAGVERMLKRTQPVIIDLRDAQGGDLFEALDATSLFLEGGLSVAAVDYARSGRKDYRSLPGQRLSRQRAILLVGRGTASAAEAFARALRWYKTALLVGETTYGKCLTQTLVPLRNGGALKFSNGRVLGPGGSPCEAHGMVPDVAVERANERSVRSLLQAGVKLLVKQIPDGS